MSGFFQGKYRSVRVIDVFIDELDLSGMGFKTQPNETGRRAQVPGGAASDIPYGHAGKG